MPLGMQNSGSVKRSIHNYVVITILIVTTDNILPLCCCVDGAFCVDDVAKECTTKACVDSLEVSEAHKEKTHQYNSRKHHLPTPVRV